MVGACETTRNYGGLLCPIVLHANKLNSPPSDMVTAEAQPRVLLQCIERVGSLADRHI